MTVRKALILTASFGDGHNQAAAAVGEALEKRGITVRIVDYVEWLHPAVRSFAKFSLMQGVKRIPALYGLFYQSMSHLEPSSSIQRRINHLGMSQLRRYLRSYNPDVVVSTFPTPTGGLSELRAAGVTNVPSAAIITDYTAHRQWIHDHVDVYFAANRLVSAELQQQGVPAKHIAVTGIPIRSRFDGEEAAQFRAGRAQLRRGHDLGQTEPLFLIMGGGAGVLGDVSSWETVIRNTPAQFCVICGRNERLYRRLLPLANRRVRVLGYTEDVAVWMSMADLIISKAGGITITEALAMELPMLIYRPIPGQETRNALYAVESGAAKLVYDVKSAHQFLLSVVNNGSELERMRHCASLQQARGAASRIAEWVVSLAESRSIVQVKDGKPSKNGPALSHFV